MFRLGVLAKRLSVRTRRVSALLRLELLGVGSAHAIAISIRHDSCVRAPEQCTSCSSIHSAGIHSAAGSDGVVRRTRAATCQVRLTRASPGRQNSAMLWRPRTYT